MAHILVVDDEEPIRTALRVVLEKNGHRVSEAEDGIGGLESYKTRSPDLLITDLLMPNKGGLVLIQEVLEHDERARIIAMSGGGANGGLMFLSTARTFPGVRTLKKPFRMEELTQFVQEMLGTQDARERPR